jgi:hypothetical protein
MGTGSAVSGDCTYNAASTVVDAKWLTDTTQSVTTEWRTLPGRRWIGNVNSRTSSSVGGSVGSVSVPGVNSVASC